ncbi:RING-H2 finger protein ATL66 [Arachis duranensis]|uniref:RING-type E3 ubiquitin transferase n=2 Tax=Arachis TaxID=3817 RepID=A0A6P4E0M2_ARADU|nr:RING-H2 finger protein ATL66 [Arachis duranensis]
MESDLHRHPPMFLDHHHHHHHRGVSLRHYSSTMSAPNHDYHKFDWHFNTELEDETIELRGRRLIFVIVLFVIILITTAFFVYLRWICRSRGLIPVTSIHLRHQLPPHTQPQSNGLDAATIKKLPIVLYQAPPTASATDLNRGGALECCICLSAFRDGEKLKTLPGCKHRFHCECVDKWLTNHSSCPLCRASLKLAPPLPRILYPEPPIRITINNEEQ